MNILIINTIILLFSLFGCQKSLAQQLIALGYNNKQIEIIETLSSEIQDFFSSEYLEDYVRFIEVDGFDENNLEEYATYSGELSDEKVVELVNEHLIDKDNVSDLKQLYGSPYYIDKNESLYLEHLNDYSNIRDCIENINTKRYLPLYSDINLVDLSKNYLMLVNKYYKLPSDYEPEDLVGVDSYYGKGYLRQEVYEQYKLLYEDAYANGYDLRVVSAYRSYDYQDGLYNKYLGIDPQDIVDTYSARPGHSEHQTGLCLDVSLPGVSLDDFYTTSASKWLAVNCQKYGFIIRYESGKEDITGYQAEPWQIRYVGSAEIAEDIYNRNITFDEYYACFVEQ